MAVKEKAVCPECGGILLVYDEVSGEVVCSGCGLVVDVMVDASPEWRAFTVEEERAKSRVGDPVSLSVHDKNLSTVIRDTYVDGRGRKISNRSRGRAFMLRKRQLRSLVYTSMERNLAVALNEISRLSDVLGLPQAAVEEAAAIYRKALKMDLVRGRSIDGIAAASVYAACRELNLDKTLSEVAGASGLKYKDVARCYRLLLKRLNLSIPLPDPLTSLGKIVERLGLSGKVETEARRIIEQAKRLGVYHGKDPRGVAAAAVYMAARKVGEPVAQRTVGWAAGVTEVTVRNRFKDLMKAAVGTRGKRKMSSGSA